MGEPGAPGVVGGGADVDEGGGNGLGVVEVGLPADCGRIVESCEARDRAREPRGGHDECPDGSGGIVNRWSVVGRGCGGED